MTRDRDGERDPIADEITPERFEQWMEAYPLRSTWMVEGGAIAAA